VNVARDIRTITLGGGRHWVPVGDRVVKHRIARETRLFIITCSSSGKQPSKSSATFSEVAIQSALRTNLVFWGVTSCSLVDMCRCFGQVYAIVLQGKKANKSSAISSEPATQLAIQTTLVFWGVASYSLVDMCRCCGRTHVILLQDKVLYVTEKTAASPGKLVPQRPMHISSY
jgi:hypothetical protein